MSKSLFERDLEEVRREGVGGVWVWRGWTANEGRRQYLC